jgi:hypothetical protein
MGYGSDGLRRYYRLDRFVVPYKVRAEFLEIVTATHAVLKMQPGFEQDFIIEQQLPEHMVAIATLVEWNDVTSATNARTAVEALHQRIGFDKQEFLERNGIKAEFGPYTAVTRQ